MQIISTEGTVRNDTMVDKKILTINLYQHKPQRVQQSVSVMPAIKKALSLLGDIIEFSTENDALKTKQALLMRNGYKNLKRNY